MRRTMLATVIVLGLAAVCFSIQAEPEPAPPGQNVKGLQHFDSCTPIYATDLPLTISTPGSYCLAENITQAGSGIIVAADSVTIDLRDFALTAGLDPVGNAIRAENVSNLEIRMPLENLPGALARCQRQP